jgi:anthranilate synthase component 2
MGVSIANWNYTVSRLSDGAGQLKDFFADFRHAAISVKIATFVTDMKGIHAVPQDIIWAARLVHQQDASIMLLMIDNYDSFTYNLVQYFGELGEEVKVVRNDEIDLAGIAALKPDHIVVSPGPCTPNEAGVSVPLIQEFAGKIPILGVCLGHQSIGQAFGGRIVRAKTLMHGKTSPVHHLDTGVFTGLPSPFTATRYHSLVIERETLPEVLEVTAWTDDGEIMGVRHKSLPVEGVQFHPESILTEHGHRMLANFLKERA